MASSAGVTPRAKRRRGEGGGDVGALGLSAAKAGAKSRQRVGCRGEGGRGGIACHGAGTPGGGIALLSSEPPTPGEGRLAKPRLPPERCKLASPPLRSGKRGECMSTPGRGAALAPPRGRSIAWGPMCPPSQPCPGGTYFSGLPVDEQQEPAVPSLLAPAASAPAPGRDGPMKTRSAPEPTLVLELEGTLVCSSVLAGRLPDAAATFTTAFQGDAYEVHLKLRPHARQFLESLSKTYEIVVFTTAKQDYAEKVLDVLDPRRKLIRRCLSQRDCLCARGCYWKDLALLGRDLAKTVALDHAIQGFSSQAANWIPVPRWRGDPGDEELLRLLPLLGRLCQAGDVRTEIRRRFPLGRLLAED